MVSDERVMDITTVAVGFITGLCVGATSTGGGALLTPALILIMGISPSIAIGTGVAIAAVMKFVAGGAFIWRSQVHWQSVWRLAIGSIPGVLVGLAILQQLEGIVASESYLQQLLAILLFLAGVTGLVRLRPRHSNLVKEQGPSVGVAIVLGFVTGLLVTITSVGSGSLLLAVLLVFFPMAAMQVVGTDLAHAFLLTSVASLGHFVAGRVDLNLMTWVLLGGVPGALLGVSLATKMPEQWLRIGLSVVLIGLALQLFSSGNA